jgi:hypothetical protein
MHRIAIAALIGLFCAGGAYADVRSQERTQVRFEGALGRVLNFFGGRASRDGVVSTVTVKGDRKLTMDNNRGQLIDLTEETIYDIDVRNKRYTVTTFEELRRRMEEARRKAEAEAQAGGRSADADASDRESASPPEIEVDFDLSESGQRRTINGFDAREVVMMITVREKGKTLEENGGMVMTANTWLAPEVTALREVAEFDRRYAEKIAGAVFGEVDAQQMAAMVAMYPMAQQAMERFQAENVNMDGTAVMTTMTLEAVASAEDAKAASQQETAEPTGGGLAGLGGRLARRAITRNREPTPATPGRATIFTVQHEVLSVTPSVASADVAIPEGFRQR